MVYRMQVCNGPLHDHMANFSGLISKNAPLIDEFREFLLHPIFFLFQPHPLLLILILKYGQHRMKIERFH